jgi:oligopeptide/dipeptide ABC transporter ATP-binding protein
METLLAQVHLTPAQRYLDKFPHELSGGQRQRVAIAWALGADPEALLADEPVSMLDVSIRLGILNLLRDLKERLDLAILSCRRTSRSATGPDTGPPAGCTTPLPSRRGPDAFPASAGVLLPAQRVGRDHGELLHPPRPARGPRPVPDRPQPGPDQRRGDRLAVRFSDTGNLVVALVIGLTSWAWGARVLRAQTLSLRHRDYVEAARATGEKTWRVIGVEILPNLTAIIASGFVGTVIFAVLTEITLAFIGISQVSAWNWGTILFWAQGQQALAQGAWWWFVPAGLAIALLGTALALVNFGIDEFVSPAAQFRLRPGANRAGPKGPHAPRLHPRRHRRTGTRRRRPAMNAVLEIRNLNVYYGLGMSGVRAVRDVNLTLDRGEVLGLAGESGSGKSTLAYGATRLLPPPGVITGGQVIYHPQDGEPFDVLTLSDRQLRAFRWARTAIVFQGAMNSLNPVHTVAVQLTDALTAHEPDLSRSAKAVRVREVLDLVGISAERLGSYPHQLSGGMRHRVMIAMALVLRPEVVIMDEPTTALDVVMQRQILSQLVVLREQMGFSVVLITHDLSLLVEFSDRIAIMYGGRIVEQGPARDLYADPLHPYSAGLLGSFPPLRGPRRELTGIPGSPPDLSAMPSGCSFNPRCPQAFDDCRSRIPELSPPAPDRDDREVACWLHPGEQRGERQVLSLHLA